MEIEKRKIAIALVCGMLGCLCFGGGDWLMLYSDTAHEGTLYWLTHGAEQIPAWRNTLAMALTFSGIILYGIALFALTDFIRAKKERKVYRTLTAFGLALWIALPLGEVLFAHFSWAPLVSEILMLPSFLYWFYFQNMRKTVFPKGMDINMKNMDTKHHLGDVQETALIPLAIRANETERKMARIHDDKAVEIIRELDVDTEKLDQFFSHEGVIARTILFDETVKKLIRKYPDAVCINIGCGLDDRFTRMDNGKIQWFNVDLADSIEIRKKFFRETEREHMLAADILKPNWADGIAKSDMVIVIAEGLMMYFSREQVKTLLNSLTGSFDRGFLLAELMHPKMMNEKKHDTVKNTNAKFGWGTVTGRDLLPLDAKLTLINERSFWEEIKKYSLIGKIGSVIAGKLNNRLAVYRWQ